MYILSKDLETTGTDILRDEPVQVAWTVFDETERVRKSEVHLVQTSVPITPKAMEVHGITNDMLIAEGLPKNDVAERYTNLIWSFQPIIIIGYNIMSFDFPMWQNFMQRYKIGMFKHPPVTGAIDVMHMVSKVFNTRKWLKLEVAARKLGIPIIEDKLHDAKYDNELTYDVYLAARKILGW